MMFFSDCPIKHNFLRTHDGPRPDRRLLRRWLGVMLVAFVLLAWIAPAARASGVQITINPPGDHEFVRDLADMITPADEDAIRKIGDQLLKDTATPIIVVTIESMSQYGPSGIRIETFATLLFDQWGIGHPTLNGKPWNTGILLLVSEADRKARIELGAGWGHDKDALAQQIMQGQIITRFKQGDFSGGILAGVQSLDTMARGKPLPQPPTDWRVVGVYAGFVALAMFTGVSLVRRGSSGWAWLFWGVVFGILGVVIYQLLNNSEGSSGGGFSGGSFGGGSSGGGGATGSW